jgi:2-haloacid dehalogenase
LNRPKIKNIIFDLGGVLIDWNRRYLYSKIFTDENELEFFLDNVCSMDWNERHDAGQPFAVGIQEAIARFPQYKSQIEAYVKRWDEMFSGPIQDNVELLERLHQAGWPLYALTNWSGEMFPLARKHFPFLARFRDIVVSGDEKMKKPDSRIFELVLKRNGLQAGESLFIDDVERNILAAGRLGINVIWYRSHAQLVEELGSFGIKI